MRKITPAAECVDDEFAAEFVAFFASVASALAVPRSLGQIYGVLYASSEPLSFSEIATRLDISKGSISQGLAFLRSLGAVNEVARTSDADGMSTAFASNGARPPRVAYAPELSLRKLVGGVLQERVKPMAAAGADHLARLRQLAEQEAEGSEFFADRVRQLETWRRKFKAILPVFVALLGANDKA